jgi:hypothetical protein
MVEFEGSGPRTLSFLIANQGRDGFQQWLPLSRVQPDRLQARTLLEPRINEIAACLARNVCAVNVGAVPVIPWQGNEDLIEKLLGAAKARLSSSSSFLALYELAPLKAQLQAARGSELLVASLGRDTMGTIVGLSVLGSAPTEWITPVAGMLRNRALAAIAGYPAAALQILAWPVPPAEMRLAAKDVALYLDKHKPRQPLESFTLEMTRVLAGRGVADQDWLKEFEPYLGRIDNAIARASAGPALSLVAAASENLSDPLYLRLLTTVEKKVALVKETWRDQGLLGLYAELLSQYGRRRPDEPINHIVQMLELTHSRIFHDFLLQTLAANEARIRDKRGPELLERLEAVQSPEPVCDAYLPLVGHDTVGPIIEIAKDPACAGQARRKLIQRLAEATGENFGQARYGEFIVDWDRFRNWAEKRNIDLGAPARQRSGVR